VTYLYSLPFQIIGCLNQIRKTSSNKLHYYIVIYLTTNFPLHGLDSLDNSTEAASELEISTCLWTPRTLCGSRRTQNVYRQDQGNTRTGFGLHHFYWH